MEAAKGPAGAGLGEGGREKQAETEGFGGGETTPYDTTFVQTHRMCKSRANPDVNCGLSVTMTCQGGFILWNKRTVWWGCGPWGLCMGVATGVWGG